MPTSPGGLYRTPLGRLIFKTDEMVQVVEAPDIVRNKVSFSVFGLEGAVSLKGRPNVFYQAVLHFYVSGFSLLGIPSNYVI